MKRGTVAGACAAMLDNPPWFGLNTEHARFAVSAPAARRYPADVAPFAGTAANDEDAMRDLASLLEPGETIYVMGEAPAVVPELIYGDCFPCLQMVGPPEIPRVIVSEPAQDQATGIVPLTAGDAPAMVALTDLAFPGFFRPRTCEMGRYFGIRANSQLIAMGGERLTFPGWREISAVCTHPDHTGRGYAARLIARLLQQHADDALLSFLHVSCANKRAIDLYLRLGFAVRKQPLLYPVSLRPH